MTTKELKGLIDEMISPMQVKKVLTLGKEEIKATKELLITYPQPGYQGIGTLQGGEEFVWSFHYDGKDWLFNSDLIE